MTICHKAIANNYYLPIVSLWFKNCCVFSKGEEKQLDVDLGEEERGELYRRRLGGSPHLENIF